FFLFAFHCPGFSGVFVSAPNNTQITPLKTGRKKKKKKNKTKKTKKKKKKKKKKGKKKRTNPTRGHGRSTARPHCPQAHGQSSTMISTKMVVSSANCLKNIASSSAV